MNPLSLTDKQMRQVQAAASTLRVSARDAVLRDLACRLDALHRLPGDADVAQAISLVLGVCRCATLQ